MQNWLASSSVRRDTTTSSTSYRRYARASGDAGHILGSCIVELWLTEGSETRKLVFSGDLGHADAPILRDPDVIKTADLVLMESTYGDRDHRSWDETRKEVEEIASITRSAKGNILIPAFAVGRSQLLLYWMARNYWEAALENWQIFLDSPLAIRATRVYSSFINLLDGEARELWGETEIRDSLPNLHFTLTADESREINAIRSGAIIIAGSGMCTGGRIRPPSEIQHHAQGMPCGYRRLPGRGHTRPRARGRRIDTATVR